MTDEKALVPINLPAEVDGVLVQRGMDAMRRFVQGELKEGVHFAKRGGSGKPSLEKPGAEAVFKGFLCRPRFEVTYRLIDPAQPYGYYEVRCEAVHVTSDTVLGEGMGACDTNREAGGGNQDFAWQANAALKMAEKRAMVAAAVTLGCVSEFFTQDMGQEETVSTAGFSDYPILEKCPEHGTAWRPGKYGRFHGIQGGGFCNLSEQLTAAFKKTANEAGFDAKGAAQWLKDARFAAWSRLPSADKARAIATLAQVTTQKTEPEYIPPEQEGLPE